MKNNELNYLIDNKELNRLVVEKVFGWKTTDYTAPLSL